MRCMEVFYNKLNAEDYFEELKNANWNAEPEIEEAIDEDADEGFTDCWIVWFNPKPLRK